MSAAYCGGFDFSGGQNGLQKGRKNIAAGGGGTDTAICGRRIYLYTKERRKQEMPMTVQFLELSAWRIIFSEKNLGAPQPV